MDALDRYRRPQECIDRLIFALETALEYQDGVEDARPDGYGTPQNTLAWQELAKITLGSIATTSPGARTGREDNA